jgi:hypothetical protein
LSCRDLARWAPTDRVALLLSTGLTVSRPAVPSSDPAARSLRDPGNGCLTSGGTVGHGPDGAAPDDQR